MGKARYQAFQFLENPRSSMAAKVMSILSASFVLLSLSGIETKSFELYSILLGLILSSMPEFQIDRETMTPHWFVILTQFIQKLF